jgi:NADH:ubiquinone oxidoreductase subunit F (NADH-binding)
MDRALLEGDPHRIVEGTALTAYATGASIAYIYLRSEYEIATHRITKAVADAKEAGLLGYNIYDSGFNLEIFVKKGAGAFVCGEETALINSLEGKRGMPRPRPPYPAEKGLYGKPTVVSNIETIANIPAILDKGPSWFASIGTETSKGTKVFALSGDTVNKGLIEVSMGTTIHDIVYKMGGGISHERKLKAVQIGGPTGTCMPEENINTPIDYEALDNIGAIMGSGGLVVMDENKCMVEVARYFMDFIHKESCGKCIPCREGSGRMLEILEGISKRPDKESKYETLERFKGVTQIESLAEVIMQTSLCGLGKTAPNPLISTLKWFREEYEEHIFERNCKAGVCKGLKKYYINPEKCVGCGACLKKCPVDAIIGTLKQPHFVIEDKCIGCGLCFEACKFNAIYVK